MERKSLSTSVVVVLNYVSIALAVYLLAASDSLNLRVFLLCHAPLFIFIKFVCFTSAMVMHNSDLSRYFRSTLLASIKDEVAKAKAEDGSFAPQLAIVQVGGREDSAVYIRMKIKAGEKVSMLDCPFMFWSTDATWRINRTDAMVGVPQ